MGNSVKQSRVHYDSMSTAHTYRRVGVRVPEHIVRVDQGDDEEEGAGAGGVGTMAPEPRQGPLQAQLPRAVFLQQWTKVNIREGGEGSESAVEAADIRANQEDVWEKGGKMDPCSFYTR